LGLCILHCFSLALFGSPKDTYCKSLPCLQICHENKMSLLKSQKCCNQAFVSSVFTNEKKFFCGTGVWTQGLTLSRLELYPLSHIPRSYNWKIVCVWEGT
jgi:hypothetical protein